MIPILLCGFDFSSRLENDWKRQDSVVLHEGVFKKKDWKLYRAENKDYKLSVLQYIPRYEKSAQASKLIDIRSFAIYHYNLYNKNNSQIIPLFIKEVLEDPHEYDYSVEIIETKNNEIFFKWSLKQEHAGLIKQHGYSHAFFGQNQLFILSYISTSDWEPPSFQADAYAAFSHDVCLHSVFGKECKLPGFSLKDLDGDPIKLPAALEHFKQSYQSIYCCDFYKIWLEEKCSIDSKVTAKLLVTFAPMNVLQINTIHDYLDVAANDMRDFCKKVARYQIIEDEDRQTYAYAIGENYTGSYFLSLVRLSREGSKLKACHLMKQGPDSFDHIDVQYYKDKLSKIQFSNP